MLQRVSHQIIAFSYFEVDLEAGEIRRAGLRVRLTGQPFRLLAILLARPGEVVAREEIQKEIWGANTNVDFDRGLASVANKLREALGDSADHPIYIETLARKGYRFIAPVTVLPGKPTSAAPEPARDDLHSSSQADIPKPALDTFPGVVLPETQSSTVSPHSLASLSGVTSWKQYSLSSIILVALALFFLLGAGLAVSWWRQPMSALARVQQLTHGDLLYPGPPNPESFLTLVTDGPRVYAPVLHEGQPELASMRPDGADLQTLALPDALHSAAVLNISDDGTKLLLREAGSRAAEQPLWIVPTSGQGAQRVGDVLGHDATWMPGRKDAVLVATGNTLETVSLPSGEVRPYLQLPGRAFWLRWSPDGKSLRFTLLDPDQHATSLWEVGAADRHPKPLPLGGVNAEATCCGSWEVESGRYVFEAVRGPFRDIWVLYPGHFARPRQLTSGPVAFSSPLPSADGQSVLVFGSHDESSVQFYDERTRRMNPVAPFLQGANRLSYSRDGSHVAWTDATQHLWCARADGKDLLQLTTGDTQVFSAAWSPDGETLLLMARSPGQAWGIYTLAAGGGSLHVLLRSEHNLADPSWSPDGRRVVFGREADLMGQDAGPHDIKTLDINSGQSEVVPGSGNLFSPRWSPDGAYIAALSRDQSRLLVFDVAQRQWRVLFAGGAADPVWASDSKAIYFQAIARPSAQIANVDLSGHLRMIDDVLESLRSRSTFLSGVMPDGSPVVKSQAGSGDLYEISLR